MIKKLKYIVCASTLALTGCMSTGSNSVNIYDADANSNGTEDIYERVGMEVPAVAAQMADTVYKSMYKRLSKEATYEYVGLNRVKNVTIPKIAITTFVDSETFEDAGSLGRELAEVFVHELSKKDVPIFEYKLTGSIQINKDGDYVYTRDWNKVAKKAMVSHILSGTVTRTLRGLILVSRVVDMTTNTVIASATGFIPYELLPSCYRSTVKNCKITDFDLYNNVYVNKPPKVKMQPVANSRSANAPRQPGNGTPETVTVTSGYNSGSSSASSSTTTVEVQRTANGYFTYVPETHTYINKTGLIFPATMPGTYEDYLRDVNNQSFSVFGRCSGNDCDNPVIYPASSYQVDGKLVRDVGKQSQYDRIDNK